MINIDWKNFNPLIVVPTIPINNGIRFLCQNDQLEITGNIVSSLWKILSLCNGHNNVKEIANSLNLNVEYVKEILFELVEKNVIYDSCHQYLYFHSISNYPTSFFTQHSENEIKNHKLSPYKKVKKGLLFSYSFNKNSALYDLQVKRKSCRNFSTNKKLSLDQLGNICNYAYSFGRHATPSGGSLYPLKLFCVVPYDQIDFDAGYYEYDNENDKLVLYNDKVDIEQLKYCYNDEKLAYNSPIQIIICSDFERQSYKYSNRGYRLSLLEVGHVAQNISLYCVENGLDTCELGGLLDIPLAMELDIFNYNIYPILGIAIGYRSNYENTNITSFLSELKDDYVGKDKPIKSFGINFLPVKFSSFYGAWAKFGANSKRVSGATACSYNEAVSKAIIEGYERYCSSKIRVDFVGKCENNKNFLNPNELAPLTNAQRKRYGLKEYNDGDIIEWTKDMTGKYYIPSDFVFYGHKKNNKIYFSDSSGIAAYSDYENAKRRALLELIERDAIIRNWYSQKPGKMLNPKLMCQHIKNRIEFWKKHGRNVHIIDLDSICASVFLVIIESKEYPCFVSGSAAVNDNVDNAMIKALQEAEYNLQLALENPKVKKIKKELIKSPQEHGRYYYDYKNAKKIEWLWKSNSVSNKKIKKIENIDLVVKKLDVVFIDLSEKNSSLKVVRAVSKKLVPISFGYHYDYYLHPHLKKIKFNKKIRDLPHYYA